MAVNYVAQHLATYKGFPPRQEVGSFNLNKVLQTLQANSTSNRLHTECSSPTGWLLRPVEGGKCVLRIFSSLELVRDNYTVVSRLVPLTKSGYRWNRYRAVVTLISQISTVD